MKNEYNKGYLTRGEYQEWMKAKFKNLKGKAFWDFYWAMSRYCIETMAEGRYDYGAAIKKWEEANPVPPSFKDKVTARLKGLFKKAPEVKNKGPEEPHVYNRDNPLYVKATELLEEHSQDIIRLLIDKGTSHVNGNTGAKTAGAMFYIKRMSYFFNTVRQEKKARNR